MWILTVAPCTLLLYTWHHQTSTYTVFQKLKAHLRVRHFEGDNDVICAVEGYVGAQTSSEKGPQNMKIGGQSALKFLGTMLKNTIETTCL